MVIVIELLALLYFLYKSRNDLKKIFAADIHSILWGLLVGTLLSLVIYATKQTVIGSRTIGQFVNGVHGPFIVLYLIYPVIIAVSEEFIFRYIIANKFGPFLSAIMFTALHWRVGFPTLMFLPVFVLALCQSFLLNKTKTLISLIIAHLMVTYSLLL